MIGTQSWDPKASTTAPPTILAVPAVGATPATADVTIGTNAATGDTLQVTIGSASFTYTAVADDAAGTVTTTADSFVAAWNTSTNVEVAKFTADNTAGVITFTQDTASTGDITATSTVTGTIAATDQAGTTGVAPVAEQDSYDYSAITVVTGDRVSLTIGTTTYTQEFTTDQASTLSALGALVVNGEATYAAKTVDDAGKLVFTGAAAGTALAAATTAVETSSVSEANSVDDILVTDATSAKAALAVVDGALDMMSDFRARLGASSNRMFITVDNLMSMSENTSAARSRIVDADFAAESASLAKSQVLQKAGTAMLSQANASTQDILSLLK